jgi:phenylalanine-4-hydroxylase
VYCFEKLSPENAAGQIERLEWNSSHHFWDYFELKLWKTCVKHRVNLLEKYGCKE